MAKQTNELTRIPGGNRIALSKALAQEIRDRFDKVRENRFQLFLLAAGLRKKYLNKKTQKYAADFEGWYKSNNMKELFGELPNFTKYASAGDVIDYVDRHTSDPEKYLKRLPVSMGALYEISQILTDKNGEEDFRLCLQFTAKRKSLDAPKSEWRTPYPALIRPQTTEAMVRNWRRQWNDPPRPWVKRNDKRTLPLATITVSGELFDFDRKTGDKLGCVDLPAVEELLKKLNGHFNDKNILQFKLTDSMDYLTEGYFKRKEQTDPAGKI